MAYPTSQIIVAKVDNVDDVLAIHVNELQTAEVNMTLRYVKNTSGSTVAANDVGYIDEAAEFKLTTTAYLDGVAWGVVIVGGANNADIVVAIGGSKIVVILNGNCSIGDFLYTSTTTKQAQPQTYMRPEVFAVAKTANAGGAGGTCDALLLCNTRYVSAASNIDVHAPAAATDDSDWRTTINGAPAGAVVTYNVALTSGAENTIDPAAANQFGKLRLYNETRSDYALIDDVDIGANTITLTANAPGGWADTDVITTRSQTCTDPAPPPYYFDVDLSAADNTLIPVLARVLELEVAAVDSGAGGGLGYTHPWETYVGAKVKQIRSYGAGIYNFRPVSVPLIQQRFCIKTNASGAGTALVSIRVSGWWMAVP